MDSTSFVPSDAASASGGDGCGVQNNILANGPSILVSTGSPWPLGSNPTANTPVFVVTRTATLEMKVASLQNQLDAAKRTISEQENTIHQQGINLQDAADTMNELQQEIERLQNEKEQGGGDQAMDAKEQKKIAGIERAEKEKAQKKYNELKGSLDNITSQIKIFSDELQDMCLDGEPKIASPENGESLESTLKRLHITKSKLQTELHDLKKGVRRLVDMLEMERSKNASQNSLAPPPPQMEIVQQQKRKSCEISVPLQKSSTKRAKSKRPRDDSENVQMGPPNIHLHGEDVSKRSKGRYCICERKFASLQSLRTHIRTFNEDRKFKCHLCPQSFVLFYMLKRHLICKHGLTPYSKRSVGCAECGKVFANNIKLWKHRNVAHPKKSKKASNLRRTDDQSGNLNGDNQGAAGDANDGISFIKKVGAKPTVDLVSVKMENPERNEGDLIQISENDHGIKTATTSLGYFCHCGVEFPNRDKLNGHVIFFKTAQNQRVDLSAP